MTPAQFKDRFAEFATVSDSRIQLFLDEAALSVNVSLWGIKADLGQAYLAAHLLTIDKRGGSGAAGMVTSEKVGDLSRNYAAPNTGALDPTLSATSYGIEFLRLRRSILISPMVL
jgi:hypothetical protein